MRNSLAPHLPRSATDPEQLEAMRRAAWLKQGIVVLKPEEIADPWERRVVQNLAERKFGKRKEGVSA